MFWTQKISSIAGKEEHPGQDLRNINRQEYNGSTDSCQPHKFLVSAAVDCQTRGKIDPPLGRTSCFASSRTTTNTNSSLLFNCSKSSKQIDPRKAFSECTIA